MESHKECTWKLCTPHWSTPFSHHCCDK